MYSRGGDGLAVRFVASSADDAIGAADDVIDELLGAGWKPERSSPRVTATRSSSNGRRSTRKRSIGRPGGTTPTSSTGTSSAARGLERRVVVLCVNESEVRDSSRERLYVGMSRATDLLVVVGDPSQPGSGSTRTDRAFSTCRRG
jgi:hypothetical protein